MDATVKADILISGSHLLPGCRHDDSIADGAVAVAGDTIVDIGPRTILKKKYPEVRELHEPNGLIMPGLVNTHTHAAMSCFRGFADDLPLMTWLEDHIFPVETRLDSEMVYFSTLLSIGEMIKSGTTSFCDMYLFATEVARAAEKAGIRSWLGEVLYDFPSPSYGELANGISLVRNLFSHYHDHELITITVDPHSVYTCAPSLLETCGDLAAEYGSLFVIHLAETRDEEETCQQRYGLTPVNHLKALDLLHSKTLAAHCVQVSDTEIDLLAHHSVKVSHCLESNLKLASGIAPIPSLLDKGVVVSIGTDGSASNNDVDLFSEMSSVAKAHKGAAMDPTVMSAETTLYAATMGGALALNASADIGSLEPGKKADLIVLDLKQPHLTPMYNIPSHLVYAARGGDVIHSMINGRIVMQDRTLTTIDEQSVFAHMLEISRRVKRFRDEK